MRHNYFEGVLQLRNPTHEINEFIDEALAKKGDVFITKRKKVKDGVDCWITSQHFLQVLGKKLQQKFGGEMKLSSTLFSRSRQTSRDIFRINILYRYCPVKPGEVKQYKGETVKVVKCGKGKITVKDMKTGKTRFVEYKELG
jgi:NMD protein affecting ribosome stability and mRNA decay